MIVKVVTIAVIAVCSSHCVNGICPAQENDTTVVLPYQRISNEGLSDTLINATIQAFLARSNDFALTSENPAISCKKIAELRPSYESGYYWIQGVSGAVEVYCEMGTDNEFGQSGGWMRVADVDMRNNHSHGALLDWSTISLREGDCVANQALLQDALQVCSVHKEWSMGKYAES